jgi:hypothetical protein
VYRSVLNFICICSAVLDMKHMDRETWTCVNIVKHSALLACLSDHPHLKPMCPWPVLSIAHSPTPICVMDKKKCSYIVLLQLYNQIIEKWSIRNQSSWHCHVLVTRHGGWIGRWIYWATTNNYNNVTDLHTLQITVTTAHIKSVCYVSTSLCL